MPPQAAALRDQIQGSGSTKLLTGGISNDTVRAMVPLRVQLPVLAQRTIKNAWRNKLMIRGQAAQAIFISLVVGLIYLNTTDVPPPAVQARAGALFFLATQGWCCRAHVLCLLMWEGHDKISHALACLHKSSGHVLIALVQFLVCSAHSFACELLVVPLLFTDQLVNKQLYVPTTTPCLGGCGCC